MIWSAAAVLAAAEGSPYGGSFTVGCLLRINMPNVMLLMNVCFLFSKGMLPVLLVKILN